ncbi:MAG: four helix bundle protein [Gammaproteobacteria bacterium HGW-Gammaproteobacteria-1]|nr:MAG: four helix bundle protein [Gammaproteobacteria bacterium HGW-Gammaproteobacteria-1]
MAQIERFEQLEVWKLAREMAQYIYALTECRKIAQDYALRDQMRRAAISVLSNIAEGFERGGNKEFVQFLYIAKGSAGELRAQTYVAQDMKYWSSQECQELRVRLERISRLLSGLICYLRGSGMKGERFHVSDINGNYEPGEGDVADSWISNTCTHP